MLDPVRPDRLPLGKEGTYKKAVSGGEDSYLMFHLFSDGRGWEPCPKGVRWKMKTGLAQIIGTQNTSHVPPRDTSLAIFGSPAKAEDILLTREESLDVQPEGRLRA